MATVALIGAAVVGGGLSVAGQISAGQNARRAGNISADEADRDAKRIEKQAKFEAKQFRRQGEEIIGRGIAITGASGVKVNRGSGLRTQEVDQARVEEGVGNILFSGRVASRRLQAQGVILRAQGKAAQTAGFIKGAQSILSTVSTIGGISTNASILSKLKSAQVSTNVANAVVPTLPG